MMEFWHCGVPGGKAGQVGKNGTHPLPVSFSIIVQCLVPLLFCVVLCFGFGLGVGFGFGFWLWFRFWVWVWFWRWLCFWFLALVLVFGFGFGCGCGCGFRFGLGFGFGPGLGVGGHFLFRVCAGGSWPALLTSSVFFFRIVFVFFPYFFKIQNVAPPPPRPFNPSRNIFFSAFLTWSGLAMREA